MKRELSFCMKILPLKTSAMSHLQENCIDDTDDFFSEESQDLAQTELEKNTERNEYLSSEDWERIVELIEENFIVFS